MVCLGLKFSKEHEKIKEDARNIRPIHGSSPCMYHADLFLPIIFIYKFVCLLKLPKNSALTKWLQTSFNSSSIISLFHFT